MASTVKAKTLRVTIQEDIVLNGTNYGSKIKNNLASKGLIDSFFTQAKLSTDNVKEWLTKNNRAVAGVSMSGNDPMQSLGIKSMGNALDDPANFYLKMAEGGFVEGDEFSDMIEFMPSTMMNGGDIVGIDHLTRRLYCKQFIFRWNFL